MLSQGSNLGYTFSRYHLKGLHFNVSRSFFLSETSPMSIPWFCGWYGVNLFYIETEETQMHSQLTLHGLSDVHPSLLFYLKWQVPSQVYVVFVFVHPDFCDPQGVPLHGLAQVGHVGLVCPLDVSDPGARNYFDTASARPHLWEQIKRFNAKTDEPTKNGVSESVNEAT